MSELKSLKVKNAVSGKVLTTDNNGTMQSSNLNVADIATNTDISGLDTRITALEGNVADIENQIVAINGEEV